MTEPIEIKVLTFNLWGIFNSKMREERMKHFASKVATYDVILLQEQFTKEDFDLIIQCIPRGVRETRYFRRFPSSFYGSGCAVISKYPIRSAFFYTYPLQGYPEMVLHGDFFANKGAALIKVDVPITDAYGSMKVQEVLLYTTHLVAIYQKVSELPSWREERYLPYRISQAIALAEFIINTSKPTDTIIIGGDFNSSQRSLEVQMLLILLKRRGYMMRSVLPTPNTLLDAATSNVERALANSTYTFSNKNAFNCSKTSYFKLLNMQSDIPAQIDHIFFNHAQLSLQPFENCPDAAPNFPFYVAVEDTRIPSGVVVFTENQVPLPPPVPLAKKVSNLLQRCAGSRKSYLSKRIHAFSEWLFPEQNREEVGEEGEGAEPTLYPLSDHYGVAARLVLRGTGTVAGSPGPEPLLVNDQSAVPLSEEEVMVVNNVVQYLESFTNKLNRQVTTSRYLAFSCFATLLLHVYILRNALDAQKEKTTAALQQLYVLSESGKISSKATRQTQESGFRQWVFNALQAEPKEEGGVLPPPDFRLLADELMLRPFWLSVSTVAITNVVLSFSGLASFGIGMFQRMGNYNIMKEQVRQLLNN